MKLGHNWAISDMFSWKKIFSPKFEHFSRDIEHCVKNQSEFSTYPKPLPSWNLETGFLSLEVL